MIHEERFDFLNLEGCSPETRLELESILHPQHPGPKSPPLPPPPVVHQGGGAGLPANGHHDHVVAAAAAAAAVAAAARHQQAQPLPPTYVGYLPHHCAVPVPSSDNLFMAQPVSAAAVASGGQYITAFTQPAVLVPNPRMLPPSFQPLSHQQQHQPQQQPSHGPQASALLQPAFPGPEISRAIVTQFGAVAAAPQLSEAPSTLSRPTFPHPIPLAGPPTIVTSAAHQQVFAALTGSDTPQSEIPAPPMQPQTPVAAMVPEPQMSHPCEVVMLQQEASAPSAGTNVQQIQTSLSSVLSAPPPGSTRRSPVQEPPMVVKEVPMLGKSGDAAQDLKQEPQQVREKNTLLPSKQQNKDEVGKGEAKEEPSKSAPTATSLPPPPPAESKPKSWASLFHSKNQQKQASAVTQNTNSAPASVSGTEDVNIVKDVIDSDRSEEKKSAPGTAHASSTSDNKLLNYLKNYTLNHRSSPLKPRGLSNRSNWCFVNAILQALVACPPFYNFMKSIPLGEEHRRGRWVILRAMWQFIQDTEVLVNYPKLSRRDKGKKSDDLPLGKTCEASPVLNMLLELKSDNFKVMEGRQEDAEEFLTFLLNGLNDEVIGILRGEDTDSNYSEKALPHDDGDAGNDDDWKEVGPKNRSCITRKQQLPDTPVADIFQGETRSCVQHSASEPTATLQPFFTLQLDIQSREVSSVSDALTVNFATEELDGYVCTATKRQVDASRSLSLESLPPVLVLHLKRFVYDETGCQKESKSVDFPIDLEIPREILSANSRNKYHAKRKQYKLFAVVYHNGCEATKGHYVTDVYHSGLASWLRCDDSTVHSISETSMLKHSSNSAPYILFYRRCDTMFGADKSNKAAA